MLIATPRRLPGGRGGRRGTERAVHPPSSHCGPRCPLWWKSGSSPAAWSVKPRCSNVPIAARPRSRSRRRWNCLPTANSMRLRFRFAVAAAVGFDVRPCMRSRAGAPLGPNLGRMSDIGLRSRNSGLWRRRWLVAGTSGTGVASAPVIWIWVAATKTDAGRGRRASICAPASQWNGDA